VLKKRRRKREGKRRESKEDKGVPQQITAKTTSGLSFDKQPMISNNI